MSSTVDVTVIEQKLKAIYTQIEVGLKRVTIGFIR